MTALTFPSNPVTNDTYTGPNDTLYTFDGIKWVVTTTTLSGQIVTNFVQDSSANILTSGTHDGIIVDYNTDDNVINLSLNIDGGDASSGF